MSLRSSDRPYDTWTVTAPRRETLVVYSAKEADAHAHALLRTGSKKATITERHHQGKWDRAGKKTNVTKVEPSAAQKKAWR